MDSKFSELAHKWAVEDKQIDTQGFNEAMNIMKHSNNKIFYIMGKSASGKDTIFQKLMYELQYRKDIPEGSAQYKPILMSTTRPMRSGESNGKEYNFVNYDWFLQLSHSNQVAEYRDYSTVHGTWTYFTPWSELDVSKYNRIGIGTLESYMQLKSKLKDKIVPIYIYTDDVTRFTRAFYRELKGKQDFTELCRRYLSDNDDYSIGKIAAANIQLMFNNSNSDITKCVDSILRYIRSFA